MRRPRGADDARQALGKDAACAARRGAAQPPCPDLEDDPPAMPGQVGKRTPIAAVQPPRRASAARAGRLWASRAGNDGEAIGFGMDVIDNEADRDEREEAFGHSLK